MLDFFKQKWTPISTNFLSKFVCKKKMIPVLKENVALFDP